MVTRPRLWLKTTSEKGPHLSCVVLTKRGFEECLKPSSLEGSFMDAFTRLLVLLVVVGCCWLGWVPVATAAVVREASPHTPNIVPTWA